MTSLLEKINSPHDLRTLETKDLPLLAKELRQYLLESVSHTGGHLSSNLGTVELTIALHYVFNTPEDRLIWDVGHQTYSHKILTGRRQAMSTLRQFGGISGFPRRQESPYDTFGTAHSSTSISAALGMALAAQQQKSDRHVVAVIGDGAMTAGMAFEAMNNVGVYHNTRLIVVLNDNDMSISPPVGALNRYLARLLSGRFYAAARKASERVLGNIPPALEFARRFEEHAKGMVVPGTLFEEFGFNYIGPIDGHDLDSLIPTLSNLKMLQGPQFLHIVTRKGRGYQKAEEDPILYHGPGRFDLSQGIIPAPPKKPTYTQVFGEWLCDMAEQEPRLVGITPAMREGSGLVEFAQRFPDRYYDVGIAEQHALTFAAGLACEGIRPVVAIYSTFLQRGYDQLIHDIALQKLPILFAIDRAGLVGADGATHAGSFDLSYLRCIPNMAILAPSDENECRQMLYTGFLRDHPVAVRYPRGAGPGTAIEKNMSALPWGKGQVVRKGKEIALLAFGSMVSLAKQVGETLDATVVNMRFVKPLDIELLEDMAKTHRLLVTLEENVVAGGAGSACAEALGKTLGKNNISTSIRHIGLPDQFIDHGDPTQLLALHGLSVDGVIKQIIEMQAK